MTKTRTASFALVLSFALAAPTLARAQDTHGGPVAVTEADLASRESWGAKKDQRVVLTNVKFRGIFDGNLDIAGIAREKLSLAPDVAAELGALLAGWKTRAKTGKLDPKGHSNVRLDGIARDAGGRAIEVTDVTLLADDVPAFAERARGLEHDPERALALAREAVARAEQFAEPELREWARSEAESALDERRSTLAATDSAARIDVARSYASVAGVTSKAISVLGEVASNAEVKPADRERAARILGQDLDAVQHHGRWIARSELKRVLGFILVRDSSGAERWERRQRVELEAAVAERRSARVATSVLRTALSSRYEQAVRDGEPLLGMNKTEVAQARGLGYPVSVERVMAPMAGVTLEWDRWDLACGRALFFENGELFAWRNAER